MTMRYKWKYIFGGINMAVIIGSEYLTSITGAANGLATLDNQTHVNIAQLNLPENSDQPAGLVSGKLPVAQLTLPTGAQSAVAGLDASGKLTTGQIPLPDSTTAVAGLDATGKLTTAQIPLPENTTSVAGLDATGKLTTTQIPLPENTTSVAGLDGSGKLTTTQIPLPTGTTSVAGLDSNGLIPVEDIPTTVRNPFLGEYTSVTALTTAHATAQLGDYAFIKDATEGAEVYGFYYWNPYLETSPKVYAPAWSAQKQSSAFFTGKSALTLAAVPYIQI